MNTTKKATIIVEVDNDEDILLAETWLSNNEDKLTYISDQEGCGCCVLIWEIEGPKKIISTLPERIGGESDSNTYE